MEYISVNEQFKEAVKYLKASGIILKYGDLAKNIGISAQIMSEIMGGRMKVQLDVLQKFLIVYDISYDFIFRGTKPIRIDSNSRFQSNTPITECEKCIEKDKMIDLQSVTIDALKEVVAQLKRHAQFKVDIDEHGSERGQKRKAG